MLQANNLATLASFTFLTLGAPSCNAQPAPPEPGPTQTSCQARLGDYSITEQEVEALRSQLSVAPRGQRATELAIDVRVAEFLETGTVGRMRPQAALASYRSTVRHTLASEGPHHLAEHFSKARTLLGVRPCKGAS